MGRGRQYKEGLDYFELDCQMDDKIKLVQAEFGLKGFAVVVKLFQRIYGGRGYYCEWDEERQLLFMSENGVGGDCKNLIEEIVGACIKRGIFSENIFNKYQILTSSGIQRRYLNATSRRENVTLIKEYLLVNVDQNANNVSINSISADINSFSDSGNSQRKEEKRKVKKRKEEKGEGASKPHRPTASQMIEAAGLNQDLELAVKEWVKFKSEKREGYREIGLNSLLSQIKKKADEFGDKAIIDMIQSAMSENWKGMHLERLYEGHKTTRGEQIKNRVNEVDSWV